MSNYQGQQPSWLDKQFSSTSIVIIVLASICCALPAFIFGLVGWLTCTDPISKRNAMIMCIIAFVMLAVGTTLRLAGLILTAGR